MDDGRQRGKDATAATGSLSGSVLESTCHVCEIGLEERERKGEEDFTGGDEVCSGGSGWRGRSRSLATHVAMSTGSRDSRVEGLCVN